MIKMKVNYGMTEIKLGEEKQIVNYFITKNEENYGIKIEKEINGKLKDEAEVNDISNNENVVRNIIDELISNNNDLEQMKYVIEDNVIAEKI